MTEQVSTCRVELKEPNVDYQYISGVIRRFGMRESRSNVMHASCQPLEFAQRLKCRVHSAKKNKLEDGTRKSGRFRKLRLPNMAFTLDWRVEWVREHTDRVSKVVVRGKRSSVPDWSEINLDKCGLAHEPVQPLSTLIHA